MSLLSLKKDKRPINYTNPIAAKIQQRRYQLLVHSLLYYVGDVTLVEDAVWGEWAKELYHLQQQYPEIAAECPYSDDFKTFDPSTGWDLPYKDPKILNIAIHLLRNSGKTNGIDYEEAINMMASAVLSGRKKAKEINVPVQQEKSKTEASRKSLF